MATNSKIEWTTHTFNPWRGCTKVSEGCAHCYAETLSKRNPSTLGVWGKNGKRVVAAESYWRQPIAWNKAASKAGERHRVFCASLADVFEGPQTMPASSLMPVRKARLRLFELIRTTPHLDWLLLTKRPENVMNVIVEASIMAEGGDPDDADFFVKYGESDPETELGAWLNNWTGDEAPSNVWLGTSIENQATADERIPHLLRVPAAVRFLSVEPLLGPVDLCRVGKTKRGDDIDSLIGWRGRYQYKPRDESECGIGVSWSKDAAIGKIDWVIVGGESGPGARPCDVAWIRSLVQQCKAAGVPCFVKQLGAAVIIDDLRVREMPVQSNTSNRSEP